jgi:hypothetical protein
MSPQRKAVEKVVVALSIIALILAALLGLVVVTSQSMVKTVTLTTTAVPTQQAAEMVGAIFAEHVLSFSFASRNFTSANVSAIVSQYEGNANVTWMGHGGDFCEIGLYSGSGNIFTLLESFLGQVGPALAIANVTRTLTAEANGSVVVDSTFDFAGHSLTYGILNGTVSAEDSYAHSTMDGSWLISQETWDFIAFNTQLHPACMGD